MTQQPPLRRPSGVRRRARGFTLVEILAVLVILGILAAIAVPKYGTLQRDAAERGLDAAVAELNAREKLVWSQQRIASPAPATDAEMDTAVVEEMDTALGSSYSWSGAPGASGGTLAFDQASADLGRTPATLDAPATWSR